MPTYDYRCDQCGDFEYSQRMTDQPLETCPHCGSSVKRLISNNVGIIFKGSGFYINDSRKDKSNKAADSSANASSDSKAS